MSSLKDKIGQWVHIEIAVDNTDRRAEIFLDGDLNTTVESTGFTKRITKEENSKFTIGSSKDKQKGFRGRFQEFEVKRGKTSQKLAKSRYEKQSNGKSRSRFSMNFRSSKGSGISREFFDNGRKRMKLRFKDDDATQNVIEETAFGTLALSVDESTGDGGGLVVDDTKGVFQNIEKSTFSAMIRLPTDHSKVGFEPIMCKSDTFAFGVDDGMSALYVSDENGLVPYSTFEQNESSFLESVDDDLIVKASFDKDDKYVSFEGTPDYTIGINNSKALKNTEVRVNKSRLLGKNLDSFAVSMWVKPDQLGSATLFERPDIGFSLKTDDSGVLTITQ